jgi:hypothetical protein
MLKKLLQNKNTQRLNEGIEGMTLEYRHNKIKIPKNEKIQIEGRDEGISPTNQQIINNINSNYDFSNFNNLNVDFLNEKIELQIFKSFVESDSIRNYRLIKNSESQAEAEALGPYQEYKIPEENKISPVSNEFFFDNLKEFHVKDSTFEPLQEKNLDIHQKYMNNIDISDSPKVDTKLRDGIIEIDGGFIINTEKFLSSKNFLPSIDSDRILPIPKNSQIMYDEDIEKELIFNKSCPNKNASKRLIITQNRKKKLDSNKNKNSSDIKNLNDNRSSSQRTINNENSNKQESNKTVIINSNEKLLKKSKSLKLFSDYSKHDVEKLKYEISKKYSHIKIPKESPFIERMEFYTLKNQIKEDKLNQIVNRYRYTLNEKQKTKTFNHLIEDADRRKKAKLLQNLFYQNHSDNESNKCLSENRKVKMEDWKDIYSQRFTEKLNKKNEKILLKKKEKENLLKKEEDNIVKQINSSVKKKSQNEIDLASLRLYKQDIYRKFKNQKSKEFKIDKSEVMCNKDGSASSTKNQNFRGRSHSIKNSFIRSNSHEDQIKAKLQNNLNGGDKNLNRDQKLFKLKSNNTMIVKQNSNNNYFSDKKKLCLKVAENGKNGQKLNSPNPNSLIKSSTPSKNKKGNSNNIYSKTYYLDNYEDFNKNNFLKNFKNDNQFYKSSDPTTKDLNMKQKNIKNKIISVIKHSKNQNFIPEYKATKLIDTFFKTKY